MQKRMPAPESPKSTIFFSGYHAVVARSVLLEAARFCTQPFAQRVMGRDGTPPGTIIGLSEDHKDHAKCRRYCRDRHRELHAQTKKGSYGNDIRDKLGPGTTPSLPNYMYAELCRIATIDTKHDMTHVFHLAMPEISFNSKSNSKYKDIPAQETEPRCFGELCFWPSPQLRRRTCQTLENASNQLED